MEGKSGAIDLVFYLMIQMEDKKPIYRRKENGSNLNETAIRGWCAFWSPNSSLESEDEKKYIFTERNGIYIIDLQKKP